MKKEEKLKLKEIGKELELQIKSQIKQHKYKKIQDNIYKIVEKYLCITHIYKNFYENKFYINVRLNIKPYLFDNYFWEIFDMASNIEEKESLRVIGAFSFPKFKFLEKRFYLEGDFSIKDTVDEIIKFSICETNNFIEFIEKEYNSFENFILTGKELDKYFYYREEYEVFSLISLKKYKEAKERALFELGRGQTGSFTNGKKNLFEYVVDWCEDKENE